ncbi:MAG: hypothetical protein JWQ49_4331 [Edaphobacter sp.]|nr:hypothetical protein [Edaphobacter sp.]
MSYGNALGADAPKVDPLAEHDYDQMLEEARAQYAVDSEFRESVNRVREAIKKQLPEPRNYK